MTTRSPADEVEAAYAAWNDVFNRGDAAAVGRLYLDEARFLPATHQVIVGGTAVAGFFTPLLAAGMTGHANELITAGAEGRLLFGASRWTVRTRGKDGNDQTSSGFAVHVFERQQD